MRLQWAAPKFSEALLNTGWWNQVIGLMHRLSSMPEDDIHADILKDNIADARGVPRGNNPPVATGLVALSSSTAVLAWPPENIKGQIRRVWDGLHVSPRTAPSKRAKLCTCFAWFLRHGHLRTMPCFEIPLPISRLQLLMQFRDRMLCQ